jgi:uncharacterized protein (DUF1778 family)
MINTANGRQTDRIGIRLTTDERSILEAMAKQEQVSLSKVVRRAIVREAERSISPLRDRDDAA